MAKGNKGGSQETVAVGAQEEWRAYDKLPPAAREVARELCKFDYSAEQLLTIWNEYCYRNIHQFKEFMQRSDRQVIEETKGDWPSPPTSGRKTSAYDRAVARQSKLK